MAKDEEKEIEPILTEQCPSVVYNLEVLKHFAKENYVWRLDSSKILVNIYSFWHRKLYMKTWYSSKFFLSNFFGTFCPKIYIRKFLKQFSTENYT